MLFPKVTHHVLVPPIKCQGIKSKLVNFIFQNIKWDGNGTWIEPFLGSGVVLFNARPEKAIVGDTNKHIIQFYKDIQSGKITGDLVRKFLEYEGELLRKKGEEHYYEIRERFNKEGSSLDFLFLNRSCFNGVMRFNKKGEFNVPFCRKPERFRQALITKIVNQIDNVALIMKGKKWEFVCQDWRETIKLCTDRDFVYMDPPYIGRHTDYYNQWSEEDAIDLARKARELPGGFALSLWAKNKYRENEHLYEHWTGFEMRYVSHFYHVGASENLRNEMEEVVVIKNEYAAEVVSETEEQQDYQKEQDKKSDDQIEIYEQLELF